MSFSCRVPGRFSRTVALPLEEGARRPSSASLCASSVELFASIRRFPITEAPLNNFTPAFDDEFTFPLIAPMPVVVPARYCGGPRQHGHGPSTSTLPTTFSRRSTAARRFVIYPRAQTPLSIPTRCGAEWPW